MEEKLKQLIDLLVGLRGLRSWGDANLNSDYHCLVRATVRLARRFCMLTGRTPADFDARLGNREFWENPWR